MKQIMTVFAFTYMDAVKKKAFIISTVIMMVLIAGICAIPAIGSLFENDEETTIVEETVVEDKNKICYYMDDEAIITAGLENLQAVFADWNMIAGDATKEAEYRAEIKESENVSMVKVSWQGELPFITVVNKNLLSGISESTVMEVLSDTYIYQTLQAQGIGEETIAFAQSTLPYTVEREGAMNLGGYVVGIILVMLTFFAVYYYGYGVSMSVATEKTTRVMETLVVSAKPSRILFGKCLGMGVLGLTQFAGIFIFAAICYKLMVPEGYLLGGVPVTLDAFTLRSGILIVVFFILGYALYAMMNAVCGATVSKIEDLNSAMMPVMMIALISFYVAYFSLLSAPADSMMQKIALYVPFCSPFIMPYKLLNSDVATMDICISIVLLIVSIVIVSAISVRLYSSSVLHYGKKLKWKELYKRQ